MDKLQEIISDLSLWQLASEEELQPCDINAGPCYIIEKRYVKEIMIGFMKKQQAIIEENKRQQEIMVHQFRQAQEEIQRLKGELKQAHEKCEMKEYLILTTRHRDMTFGGSVHLFWGINSSGYTAILQRAGLYTKEEAFKIGKHSEGQDIPVHFSQFGFGRAFFETKERFVQILFCIQYLRSLKRSLLTGKRMVLLNDSFTSRASAGSQSYEGRSDDHLRGGRTLKG
ncbi:hypothetical protein ACUUYQ_06375 [Bacillus halotolerans]|uniref:hypothetical protein n=1 Tax=Bacillus halotolerans TaxID=260554 RepID=UPI0040452A15